MKITLIMEIPKVKARKLECTNHTLAFSKAQMTLDVKGGPLPVISFLKKKKGGNLLYLLFIYHRSKTV